jgi:hypothetical protein
MSGYGGLVFVVDEPRRAEKLDSRLSMGREFSDTLSAPDFKLGDFETGVLSFDRKHLSFFCLLRRGRLVATAQYQIHFQKVVELGEIEVDEFKDSPEIRDALNVSLKGKTSRFPAALWQKFLSELQRLRPHRKGDIEAMEISRDWKGESLHGDSFVTIAEEKDAVGLALQIFGIDRKPVLCNVPPPQPKSPAPFLLELSKAILREDTMIGHDAHVVPGWEEIAQYRIGAVEFAREGQRLTVINVNRTPVEKTVGVDLIYFNHSFHAYVMVQYKRMSHQPGTGWFFRPTEVQCQKELVRMRNFKLANPDTEAATSVRQYRLSTECFFFKLCETESLNPTDGSLIQGMYVPFDYWELLLKAPEIKGPGGGLRFTYENVQRHLNNTQFADMVQRGWVGSRSKTTQVITELIKESLQGSRSAIVGIANLEAKS